MTSPAIASVLEGMIITCVLLAIVTDCARRIIPNRLVLLVLTGGIGLRLLSVPGLLWLAIFGPTAVLLLLGLLASRDLIGWGDTKLITAVSVAVPVQRLPILLLAIALVGGVLSCVYLAIRFALRCRGWAAPLAAAGTGPDAGVVLSTGMVLDVEHTANAGTTTRLASLLHVLRRERARIIAGEPLPYGVAIAAGTLYTLATG